MTRSEEGTAAVMFGTRLDRLRGPRTDASPDRSRGRDAADLTAEQVCRTLEQWDAFIGRLRGPLMGCAVCSAAGTLGGSHCHDAPKELDDDPLHRSATC